MKENTGPEEEHDVSVLLKFYTRRVLSRLRPVENRGQKPDRFAKNRGR
jgi:hypothetical protein